MTCYFHVSSCSDNIHTLQHIFLLHTHFLSIKPMWKFLPELMLWLIADKGREAQEWGIQSSCPGSVSPFYSWAAKPFLSPWILAYKWDFSPPDKPAAPTGGAELRSRSKRGWAQRKEKALQGGGSRRGSSRQSWREALIHALLGSPSKQGRNIRNSWTIDTGENSASPAGNTLFPRSQMRHFSKRIITSVLDSHPLPEATWKNYYTCNECKNYREMHLLLCEMAC